MALHVIVGAGPVGTATANLLAERGEQVRVVTRRGTGPEHPVDRAGGRRRRRRRTGSPS